jgi:purine-nucleoside phosphorylase
MTDKAIFKAKPFKGFSHKTVVYVPVDSPSRLVQKVVEKNAVKERIIPTGHLYQLKDKVVLYGCIGAPSAALSLESLISAGAQEIVILGFCGSLNRRARLLDAVSVVEAFSEEGTSQHYFPKRKDYFPSLELRDKIEDTIRDKGLACLTGSIVSTDAPYRETLSWLEKNLGLGIDCVDMETSAVFALAEFHKIGAAALMLVSDELSPQEHKTGFDHPDLEERIHDYFLPFINPPSK